MTDILPDAVRRGLEAARSAARRRGRRLCIHDRGQVYRILRLWKGGFALSADAAPPRRGYVDLYDGSRHLARCLILATGEEQDGERFYEVKVETRVSDRPAPDYEVEDIAPAALLPRLI